MAETFGSTKDIVNASDKMIEAKQILCKPHKFGQHAASVSYTEGHTFCVAESGPSDLIEPCHEFKAFKRKEIKKFVDEVIRFGAACMNRQTNGTIHFGILNDPHGEICGVPVHSNEREIYDKKLRIAIKERFEFKHINTAERCFRPPRFVEVLTKNSKPSGKFVIEVDIVPHHKMCKDKLFHTVDAETKKKKQFFIRDGSSSRDLLAPNTSDKKQKQYRWYVDNVKDSSELRKQAESKDLKQMITDGISSLFIFVAKPIIQLAALSRRNWQWFWQRRL
ncbi:sterile alpha motif domain-containing protein 9-like [Boleophthalmus pectinirostris]|uniref:sterile alpha motif domain-containing protein 9-like n=1 Tax=Boleophthalmus pectinirostris TaxID=150288 RepID=UPI00242E9E3C|nr:sterile alpha motif domain-containing protein 9-like [Boleophthalmus pectinirostris]